MSYEDLLRKYQRLDRTRIFGPDWRITQQWTSLHVPWSADYHQTRFSVNVTRTTPVVIVLSQLDRTYFAGLQGQYSFKLQFRVQKAGDEEDYIVRSNVDYYMDRSVSTDITLETGSYFVLVKITAVRLGGPTMDEVIADHAELMRDKLIQVGLSYDIAHAKGVIVETEKEKEEREGSEKAQAAVALEKKKKEAKSRKEELWKKNKRSRQGAKIRAKKREKFAKEKAAKRRLHEANEYHSEEPEILREPERDSSYPDNATSAVSGGRSFTGEFIAAYERCEENPSPNMPGLEDVDNGPPANDTNRPLSSVFDELTPDSGEKSSQDHPPTPKVQINGVDTVTNVKPLKRRPAPLTPSAIPDRGFEEPEQAQQNYEREAAAFTEPQWSDSDTASEFSWQTDLDFDPLDGRSPDGQSERGQDCEGDLYPEPWNAVCVVGLRVYSKDPDLSLEVVRPNPHSDGVKRDVGDALDRDDPAKGAVAEKWAKTPMRETFDLDEASHKLAYRL
jgi:6,7-dimethyl-8-ribityllumazine synthase